MSSDDSKSGGQFRGCSPTLVLAVLQDGARHGYDIAREVERRSGNALTFTEGTLYPVLHTLEKNGSVLSEWERTPGERARRIYRLTPKGEAELTKLVDGWQQFSEAVNSVLGTTRPLQRPDLDEQPT
jgi:PadR family transcriptional regulator PadR